MCNFCWPRWAFGMHDTSFSYNGKMLSFLLCNCFCTVCLWMWVRYIICFKNSTEGFIVCIGDTVSAVNYRKDSKNKTKQNTPRTSVSPHSTRHMHLFFEGKNKWYFWCSYCSDKDCQAAFLQLSWAQVLNMAHDTGVHHAVRQGHCMLTENQ